MPKFVRIKEGYKDQLMLTDKQERFVEELIKGKSQREAYKIAYDAEKMKDTSIDNKASELFKKVEIRGRYEELRAGSIAKSGDDAESMRAFIIEQLKKIASGELCESTTEYDAEGNITKQKKTVKPADVKNAMDKLAEFYGVTEQVDQKITVVFQESDYAD